MYRKLIFVCAAVAVGLGSSAKADAEAAASAEPASINANAAVDGSTPLTAGSIIKDARGATIGKIERVVSAPSGDRVVVRIGSELVALPATSFDVSGKFVTTGHSKAQLRSMSRAAGS